jgi:hypothetical protein
MKAMYRLIRRSGIFYSFETATGKWESLGTRDRAEAMQELAAKNQARQQPALNLKMARVYLSASDPKAITRTWRDVLNSLTASKRGENKPRWERMDRHRPLSTLWSKVVIETTAEDFWTCLDAGTVTTNKFLRIIRNFAIDLGWLPHPLIPGWQWPPVHYGAKRAITVDEHRRILEREKNEERRRYPIYCVRIGLMFGFKGSSAC